MRTTRELIAEAVDTVPGVRGHQYRPAQLQVGDCYPLIGGITRARGLIFTTTWRVMLVLGGDERVADRKLEDLLLPIAVALQPVAHVDSADAIAISTEAGTIYGAQFTARSD